MASPLGTGLNSVSQKMAELELSLYNCKQNVQIDVVTLSFHPEIVMASRKVTYIYHHQLYRISIYVYSCLSYSYYHPYSVKILEDL